MNRQASLNQISFLVDTLTNDEIISKTFEMETAFEILWGKGLTERQKSYANWLLMSHKYHLLKNLLLDFGLKPKICTTQQSI